ncbi:acetate--CoA ligase family protein [Alphaproteobacteria bacterium]|nr:acetate--CoA ligase family protein [Alphaproteobacteria bacterium]
MRAYETLDQLTAPQRVAIVGASDNPTRIGGRPISYMLNHGYTGQIFPVNPKNETIQGLPAYAQISEIPEEIDFALIAVKSTMVAEQVRAAAQKGARTALIFSSGFAEMDASGRTLQEELVEIGNNTGIRILGPNCLGLFNAQSCFFPTFTATIDRAKPEVGGVGIASQSGAYGSHIYMACHSRGLGINHWVTTGNEADIEVAEVIKLMATDESVHTILAYVESVKDGALMIDALETARANRKPVIVTKVGQSEIGAAAAASHTASLAGEDKIYDAIFRQYGAFRVSSTEEMTDLAVAAKPRIYPAGKKVGLVTISGGAGILMADAADALGLDVAPMPKESQDELKEIVPFASPVNPVDVTAQFFNDLSLVPRFTRAMLDKGGYDALVGFWTSIAGSPILGEPLLAFLSETMASYEDRLFLHVMLAEEDMHRKYQDNGFPTFSDPTRALVALNGMMFFGQSFANNTQEDTPDLPAPTRLEANMNEQQTKAVLASFDLPVVEDRLCLSVEDVRDGFAAAGRPVAMKILSPDILHKTDIGGVMLNLKTEDEAVFAYQQILDNALQHAPDAKIDGVMLSPMIGDGVDLILGAQTDPIFGAMVMVGIGGIHAELLKDVTFMRAPISPFAAHTMLERLQLYPLLTGVRGVESCDIDAVAKTISDFSAFIAAHSDQLSSFEINPLRALPDGCVALDALAVCKVSGG